MSSFCVGRSLALLGRGAALLAARPKQGLYEVSLQQPPECKLLPTPHICAALKNNFFLYLVTSSKSKCPKFQSFFYYYYFF